ncbi:hypothetical protein J7J13_00930 [bacterium]|nr:hypothetical protein [bacterium]
MRAGMWLGRNNANIFPKMKLRDYIKFNLEGGKRNGRIKNNKFHSVYYEYEIKNKKLYSLMHAKTGKKIAKEKLKFNKMFLDRFNKRSKRRVLMN